MAQYGGSVVEHRAENGIRRFEIFVREIIYCFAFLERCCRPDSLVAFERLVLNFNIIRIVWTYVEMDELAACSEVTYISSIPID